jgi:hypothetical protein
MPGCDRIVSWVACPFKTLFSQIERRTDRIATPIACIERADASETGVACGRIDDDALQLHMEAGTDLLTP